MSEFRRTVREDCIFYDSVIGCQFGNKKLWCAPWGVCVSFEDKKRQQQNKSTEQTSLFDDNEPSVE